MGLALTNLPAQILLLIHRGPKSAAVSSGGVKGMHSGQVRPPRRWPRREANPIKGSLGDLAQEPDTLLCLIGPVIDDTVSGIVACFACRCFCFAKGPDQTRIVVA